MNAASFLKGALIGLFSAPLCGLLLLGSLHVIMGLWGERKKGILQSTIIGYQIAGVALLAFVLPASCVQTSGTDGSARAGLAVGVVVFAGAFYLFTREKKNPNA